MDIIRYILVLISGAIASLMANRGVAVFNDGFRPIYPQYFTKAIDRKTLFGISFAMSFGLVVGYGIPASLASIVILAHALWLGTDIIGTAFPDSKPGWILSAAGGGVYGLFLMIGLEWFVKLVNYLPFNFIVNQDGGDILGLVATPVVIAFAAFPAVAVGKQFGAKKGIITGVISLLVYILTAKFNSLQVLINGTALSLNVNGMAMLGGMVMLLIYAAKVKRDPSDIAGSNEQLTQVFGANVERLRKNWLLLGLGSAAAGAVYASFIVAPDPISQGLVANGAYVNAAMVAFIRSIGFLPLIFSTAVTTGVYTVKGATFQASAAFLCGVFLPPVIGPIAAAVVCFLMVVLELLLFNKIAEFMDRFPAMREMGDFIREAMSNVLEFALLVGGILAVNAMMKNMGYFVVLGAYFINRAAKKPIVPLAIGPIVAIVFGLLMNILTILRLV